jgi:tetratricopeptide (TPR) repeat protein
VTRTAVLPRLLPLAFVAIAACSQLKELTSPSESQKPAAAAPQITEDMLRDRAKEQLATGIRQFESGDFDNATKNLSGALDHGMLAKQEQSTARKYLAFVLCGSGREQACRDEFRKAFEINPEFALTPAEDGHPIWGPVYRSVRTQLIAEREAAADKPMSLLPRGKAEGLLADGLVKYDAGEFDAAHKLLQAALTEGLKDKADQVKAMKFSAFCTCLLGHYRECRTEFVKIYDVDPNFDLAPAEAGHPSWTHTFASAKAIAKRRLEHEAKAKNNKPVPPVAPVTAPKK